MMRSVINEGTGAGVRAAGFTLDAAGKTGTTNDLRDAWFVGFTPELLTVVWVGLDDNQPLGLSGSQAALPIWTQFMIAGARRASPNQPFAEPERHHVGRDRPRHRQARDARLPARDEGSVPRRQRADGGLRVAQVLGRDVGSRLTASRRLRAHRRESSDQPLGPAPSDHAAPGPRPLGPSPSDPAPLRDRPIGPSAPPSLGPSPV